LEVGTIWRPKKTWDKTKRGVKMKACTRKEGTSKEPWTRNRRVDRCSFSRNSGREKESVITSKLLEEKANFRGETGVGGGELGNSRGKC